MPKQKTNSYFTNPCRVGLQLAIASSFEEVVQELRLSPEQYAASGELRAWVKRNKNLKYVPPELLIVFGFKAESEV